MNSGDRIRVRTVLPPMLAGRTGRVTGSTGRGTLVALDDPPEGFGRVCLFTVKPLRLMRWLVRLGCPVGGLVLDPFCGSGTTGIAAAAEGMRAENSSSSNAFSSSSSFDAERLKVTADFPPR